METTFAKSPWTFLMERFANCIHTLRTLEPEPA